MTAHVWLFAAVALAAPGSGHEHQHGRGFRVIEFRGDPAPGLLVNTTAGARPFDPPDPSCPTIVVVHGMNLAPRTLRFPVAEGFAEALARRGGSRRNVLGWKWNADTIIGLHARANNDHAVDHGRRLAGALLAAGLAPERLHLVGQSSGAMVVASAAQAVHAATGRAPAQVTVIEPASTYHDVVFRQCALASSTTFADHYWAPGPTGFSRPTGLPGLRETRVDVGGAWLGLADPVHSAHLNAVRWYLRTVADPTAPGGFNASVFAR